MYNCGSGQYGEHSCKIILNLDKIILNFGQWTSFKYISMLSSAGHFDQRSKTVCAIIVEGIMRTTSLKIKLNLGQRLSRRCRSKILLFLASVVILFDGEESFVQFWYRAYGGTFM